MMRTKISRAGEVSQALATVVVLQDEQNDFVNRTKLF